MKQLVFYFAAALCTLVSPAAFSEDSDNGISSLEFLIGEWQVSTRAINPANGSWQEPALSNSRFFWILDKSMIREEADNTFDGQHWKFSSTYSYDPFRKEYRAAINDNINGYMDFYRGSYSSSSGLVIVNTQNGTMFPDEKTGRKLAFRMNFKPDTSNRFTLSVDISFDAGESWLPYIKAQYTRIGTAGTDQ